MATRTGRTTANSLRAGFADEDLPHSPTPDDHPNPDAGDDPAVNLAHAITLLARSVENPHDHTHSKIREPDTFDGSDSKKLHSFLVQCQLNFYDKPTAFQTERAKVNFALSYLKGTALDWFKPALSEDSSILSPEWLYDWRIFTDELRSNFGPHDPVGDAENELENLRMRDNQRITKFMVEFNRLSTQTNWGPAALRHQFYRGLPNRIKDEIARVGKPATLTELRTLSQSIDTRYWERRAEVARENTSQVQKPSSSNTTTMTTTPKSQEKRIFPAKPTPTTSSTHAASSSKGPDLSDKLCKD